MPNVRLGIIANEAEYAVSPWHGFWMYDDQRVLLETFSAELDLRQPQEIELYGDAFDQLAAVASYGQRAADHRPSNDRARFRRSGFERLISRQLDQFLDG